MDNNITKCCAECDYQDAAEAGQMLVKSNPTFSTAKARNAAYTAFLNDLHECESIAAVIMAMGEHVDLFSKLRNEKQEGYETHGFDYLSELETAIKQQKSVINGDENERYVC